MSPLNPLDRWLEMIPEPSFVFGEPDRTDPDAGLFGPDSVSWLVHADPASAIGGIRALLLQALHPRAMAGVARWSDYREDPWGRLTRTAEYIGVITFGSSNEVQRAAAQVRHVHARLGVDEPDLLLWVHAGFVDSLLHTYRLAHPDFAGTDDYVREQVRAAELVGLTACDVFDSAQGLSDYFTSVRPELQATAEALLAARMLLVPPMAPQVRWLTPAQGLWAVLAATAFASLPVWAQQLYVDSVALPGAPAGLKSLIDTSIAQSQWLRDAGSAVAVRGIRSLLLTLPEDARIGPHVAAARTRLALAD